ncbi:hypothetical protein [Butyricicoccus sp. Marseille-Q5471]|nr:hypothetical protein [Butyricicoccus sp. Marseille-Q5471]
MEYQLVPSDFPSTITTSIAYPLSGLVVIIALPPLLTLALDDA